MYILYIHIDILLRLYSVERFWRHEEFGLSVKTFFDIVQSTIHLVYYEFG